MSVGRQYVERAWWIVAFPGGCLFLLVFSVNVLGDWLRDRLDPQARIR
jgi:peptide/nickel transport system permease protein